MDLRITPVTPRFGVRIDGVDLATPPDDATASLLRRALARHGVLVFRAQRLTPEQLLAGAAALGDPQPQNYSQFNLPGFENIGVLDYRGEQTPADAWHTDSTNRECPPKATVLYALRVPSTGGDTSFADMRAAYRALPAATRHELDELESVNTFDGQFEVSARDDARFGTPVVHPLVRTHPETGEKALWFHVLKTAHLRGMTPRASRAFLERLLAEAIRPAFTYRHVWQAGDLVIVDNRSAMHKVHADYDRSEARVLHRVILAGDRPH